MDILTCTTPPVYKPVFHPPPPTLAIVIVIKARRRPTCTNEGGANIYSINIQYRIRLAHTQSEPN